MAGAGKQGAGLTSAGYGTPALANVPTGAFLVDTKTGKSLGARKIDPRTRDYVLVGGRVVGIDPMKAAVQMSVHTEKYSSAVQEMGHLLRRIERVTPNIEQQILTTLTDAVQPLISQGLIEVVGFTHFVAGNDLNGLKRGAIFGRFVWRDLTTNREHEEFV